MVGSSKESKEQTPQKKVFLRKTKQPDSCNRAVSPKHTVGKSKVIAEIEDDYGLSQMDGRVEAEIPTFGKKQSEELILKAKNYSEEKKERIQSPQVKRNFIEINKKLLSRTELNIGESKTK